MRLMFTRWVALMAILCAAVLAIPQPAQARSGRALGIAAGVIAGAAVLGAIANANRAQAAPRIAKPRGQKARNNQNAHKPKAQRASSQRAPSRPQVASDDPFAKVKGKTLPASGRQ